MSKRDHDQLCAIADCANLVGLLGTRGMCRAHYTRLKRYGDPTFSPGPSGVPRRPVAERFWEKVDKRGPDECWPWVGHIKRRSGYGAISEGGKGGRVIHAHQAAYRLTHGDVPAGMVIDHKCRNRACVNPAHLQAVTIQGNGENLTGANSRSISGIRGVHWHGKTRTWAVRVQVHGRRYSGGYYRDIAEAERAAIALRNQLMRNNLADRAS